MSLSILPRVVPFLHFHDFGGIVAITLLVDLMCQIGEFVISQRLFINLAGFGSSMTSVCSTIASFFYEHHQQLGAFSR